MSREWFTSPLNVNTVVVSQGNIVKIHTSITDYILHYLILVVQSCRKSLTFTNWNDTSRPILSIQSHFYIQNLDFTFRNSILHKLISILLSNADGNHMTSLMVRLGTLISDSEFTILTRYSHPKLMTPIWNSQLSFNTQNSYWRLVTHI